MPSKLLVDLSLDQRGQGLPLAPQPRQPRLPLLVHLPGLLNDLGGPVQSDLHRFSASGKAPRRVALASDKEEATVQLREEKRQGD